MRKDLTALIIFASSEPTFKEAQYGSRTSQKEKDSSRQQWCRPAGTFTCVFDRQLANSVSICESPFILLTGVIQFGSDSMKANGVRNRVETERSGLGKLAKHPNLRQR
jgi:hypothetical protein